MDDTTVLILQHHSQAIKILKWKVSAGCAVPIGRVILLYDFAGVEKTEQRKLKATQAGTVHELIAPEGAIVQSGEPLLRLRACIHPTVMKDMCAECGADLRKEEANTTASVPMVHSIPELKVSEEVAQKLGKADGERLIRDRKLVLLVDLDQTLIHTTNDNIPANIKDVYHFQLYGANSPWYHTRLRPGTHTFLSHMSQFFELHICTFGARNYAHMIAMFLDTEQKYFANRILSRDECFDPTSKKANLKALFPCGDDMVCIIDDREDVWSHATNLIHVKPYHFFKHTGDINAPPGLDKQDADSKHGVDLTNIRKAKLNGKNDKAPDPGCETSSGGQPDDNLLKNGSKDIDEEYSLVLSEDAPAGENDSNGNPGTAETTTKSEASQSDEPVQVHEETTNKEASADAAREQEELIEIEDADDYLLYLEDILKLVHRRFYEQYDKLEAGRVPDLKLVIPSVRSEVLKGTKLAFSGLVPTHIKLEQSKAYQVARSLGAVVTQDMDDATTHLVAVRPGTAKVNAGRRKKHLNIVTPDWLWACAERWEHIDEAIYPLNAKGSKNRHPPPHCSSPEHVASYPVHEQPAARKRTPSGRFMDTINPLMSFSRDDIADMDKEVEDILEDESDDSSESGGDARPEEEEKEADADVDDCEQTEVACRLRSTDETSSSSAESLTSDLPRGHKRMRDEAALAEDGEDRDGDSTLDEVPSAKFRRGEQLESDLDIGQESNTEGSDDAPDDVDDGEWNMMGAALEREFLSNN